jgi:hypothetical protein
LILWNPARSGVATQPKRVNPSPAGNSFKGWLKSGIYALLPVQYW